MNIGLFGAGRIGYVHARAIANLSDVDIVAVADVSEESAAKVLQLSGARFDSVEGILADPDIQAVIIASPTALHADQIELAALAGKHIFCEKPIDLDVQRVRSCLDVVKRTGVQFMIGFNRRFDPSFNRIKQDIVSGAIGQLELLQITSRDPRPPEIAYIGQSGGLFRDMMIHDFDMARYLFGEEIVEVQANASVLIDPDIGKAGDVDTAVVSLRSVSGKLAVITNSRRTTYGYDQRIEAHGSKGMLSAGNHRANTVTLANSEGYRNEPLLDFFLERYALAYELELSAFVDAVSNAQPVSPTSIDGLKSLELAEAAIESLQSRKTVFLAH